MGEKEVWESTAVGNSDKFLELLKVQLLLLSFHRASCEEVAQVFSTISWGYLLLCYYYDIKITLILQQK